jgi:hypothetical protein
VTESGERDAGFIEEKTATDTENCCALCEEQQWTRIAGSVRANDIPACAYFSFNANNNKCRLFSSAARTAALTLVAGVTGGYPMQCADEDLVQCTLIPEEQFVDPGALCIDFHDSLTSSGVLSNTALASTLTYESTVNFTLVGEYDVTYTCNDLTENVATNTRNVKVHDTVFPILTITLGHRDVIDDLYTIVHEAAARGDLYLAVANLLNKKSG